MLEAFVEEDNFTVWSSISNIIGKLNVLMAYTNSHAQFKQFGQKIVASIARKLGWDPKEKECK